MENIAVAQVNFDLAHFSFLLVDYRSSYSNLGSWRNNDIDELSIAHRLQLFRYRL